MILLDPRAGSITIRAHIPSQHKVVVTMLDSGDFGFVGHSPRGLAWYGIELKHLGDFLGSIETGRFNAKQLLNMHDDYDIIFVVIQDRVRSDYAGNLQVWTPRNQEKKFGRYWREHKYDRKFYEEGYWAQAFFGRAQRMLYSTFWAMIAELSVGASVNFLFTGSNEETGSLVGMLHGMFSRSWDTHKLLKCFDESLTEDKVEIVERSTGTSMLVKPSTAANVIHKLVYGIGWDKAMAAAEHFGTVERAVLATEADWQKVDGIGRTLAARAVKASKEEHHYRTRSGKPDDQGRKQR
jgi:ERCC4-type nuclease